MQTPMTNNINLFPLISKFYFSRSHEKCNCRQDIILPQANADLNYNLYKTGRCILFLVGCILDLGSHVGF